MMVCDNQKLDYRFITAISEKIKLIVQREALGENALQIMLPASGISF